MKPVRSSRRKGMEQFATSDNFLAQQFGPEQLEQIATPALRLGVPAEGAAMGESWKQEREITLGPDQKLVASFDVRYARDELLENRPHGVIEYGANIDADLQTAIGGGKMRKRTCKFARGVSTGPCRSTRNSVSPERDGDDFDDHDASEPGQSEGTPRIAGGAKHELRAALDPEAGAF